MLPDNPISYDDMKARFAWRIPSSFNIGLACADWVAATTPDKPAIIDFTDGAPHTLTFSQLAEKSTRFAAALHHHGIARGDRVAIMQPQSHECVIAHLGTYKAGAIAVPLATQFGAEAMRHRLTASGAKAFITDVTGIERLSSIQNQLPTIETVICTEPSPQDALNFQALIEKGSAGFPTVQTGPDDPAMMLFTSGTTGQPKGALHGHRVLLGHLPGIQMAQGFMPQKGDRFWTPSDWAWAGGLLNALLPSLYFGVTVIAARAPKFEPDWALDLIKRAGIRNIFMPPTALKMMQTTLDGNHDLNLRTIGCAGEALGRETLNWAHETLGIQINEFYGQTECNAIISACHQIGVWQSGSMGKAVPGHSVDVLTDDGAPTAAGEVGEIAIHKSSPVMFLNYFNDPQSTAAKFHNDWMLTGDRALRDANGYFHFQGRNDDIITSAGYRIGPSEVEDCLTGHPTIALAAVVGTPDETRTQIVTAFIKLKQGVQPNATLESGIRAFVKTKLSAHEYPRKIHFVDDIPLTESGKIIRRHFR